MEELNKNEIRKIAYNCKQATFLIEKQQLESLTIREKLELKIHLAGCSVCRTFQQQSVRISLMVKDLFHHSQPREIKLDETFKNELQERIKEKLNEN